MRIKEYSAEALSYKADGDAAGTFEALVSVFGNIDSVGDKVIPGAFAGTLAEWTESGDPIPVIWSHNWADPFSHIGHVIDAKETDRGLFVKGQLDLANPSAAQVGRLLKARRVKQFSFAYDVLDGAYVEPENEPGYYELRKLKLHEVGPCLLGANQETELITAKAGVLVAGIKAGRVLSQSNYDTLRGAYESIGKVLESAKPADDDGKTARQSQADAPRTDDEPQAKSEDAVTSAPRRALAVARIRNL